MSENLKSKIYPVVEMMYLNRSWIPRTQERLLKTMWQYVPLELIKEIIQEIKDAKKNIRQLDETLEDTKQAERADGWLKTLSSETEELPYEVTEEHYIFRKGNNTYPVLITTVKAMFECYSARGKNMTGEEIRQMFKLKAGVFELIKSQTGLQKSSHIDDPVTLSRLTDDELDKHIDGKVNRVIEDRYIEKFKKAVDLKKENDLKKFALSNRWYDLFIEKLEVALKKFTPIDFAWIKIPTIKNDDTKDVFITDAHIGKKWTDGIVIRFKKLTRDLVETPEKNVNITFGGDLGELFVPYGEMHPGQKLGMEEITTEDLIMLIVDVFEQMLVTLYKAGKTVTFNGMGGNHDRFTDKKEFDPYRTPAMIVYRFIQKMVENTSIKINILRDRANVIRSGNVKYVFIHGDWLSEAEIKRRALAEIEDGVYLIIVSWDKHHYRMSEISDRVLWIQSPALAGAGKYDESLGLSSLPWSVEFTKNSDGMVDFTVKRYK